ncbi:DUF7669 domain-containing protein [Tumebacillus avium]
MGDSVIKRNGCREEVLLAISAVIKQKGRNSFTVTEVLHYLKGVGSTYKESTIRTQISSRCCSNSPNHHATTYRDLERIGAGVYRSLHHI